MVVMSVLIQWEVGPVPWFTCNVDGAATHSPYYLSSGNDTIKLYNIDMSFGHILETGSWEIFFRAYNKKCSWL